MNAMKALGLALGISLLGLAVGCAGHEDGKTGKPSPTTPAVATAPPELEPELRPAADWIQVAVASVQLQDDCPAPPASPPAAAEPSMQQKDEDVPPGVAERRVPGFAPHCVQSMVQISIESEAEDAVPFSVREVRLKKAGEQAVLGTMEARDPKIWDDSKYAAWDQSIASDTSIKVAYALGDPDWGKVGKALGGSTWGPMYVVEIDVEIDGKVRTIVSPQIPRDEPENIVT